MNKTKIKREVKQHIRPKGCEKWCWSNKNQAQTKQKEMKREAFMMEERQYQSTLHINAGRVTILEHITVIVFYLFN